MMAKTSTPGTDAISVGDILILVRGAGRYDKQDEVGLKK